MRHPINERFALALEAAQAAEFARDRLQAVAPCSELFLYPGQECSRYFVNMGFFGAVGGAAAAGENARVAHAFQPLGRSNESNSS